MAHDGRVVRQADVLGLVAAGRPAAAIGGGGRRCVLVDDEGARDIDADRARVAQRLVNLDNVGGGPRAVGVRQRPGAGVRLLPLVVVGVMVMVVLLPDVLGRRPVRRLGLVDVARHGQSLSRSVALRRREWAVTAGEFREVS